MLRNEISPEGQSNNRRTARQESGTTSEVIKPVFAEEVADISGNASVVRRTQPTEADTTAQQVESPYKDSGTPLQGKGKKTIRSGRHSHRVTHLRDMSTSPDVVDGPVDPKATLDYIRADIELFRKPRRPRRRAT